MKKLQVTPYLINIINIHTSLEMIRKRDDTDISSLKYFEVEEPKFGRFYLLPKAHYIVF